MKPPQFRYHCPETVAEALAILSEFGNDAKVLAGGQSLVPSMNFRLARPSHLVDINRLSELEYMRVGEGGTSIGAMARQRSVEKSAAVAAASPLLVEAVSRIGHLQIRTRGTIGGSLAHADPAAELPAVAVALGGKLRLISAAGERWVPASEFFVNYLTTSLRPDELLAEVWLPSLPTRSGAAFVEFSRRYGDFAIVGVAATVTLDDANRCLSAHLAIIGVGPTPLVAVRAEQSLVGAEVAPEACAAAGQLAADATEPTPDLHATGEYRKHLASILTARALVVAGERARANGDSR